MFLGAIKKVCGIFGHNISYVPFLMIKKSTDFCLNLRFDQRIHRFSNFNFNFSKKIDLIFQTSKNPKIKRKIDVFGVEKNAICPRMSYSAPFHTTKAMKA